MPDFLQMAREGCLLCESFKQAPYEYAPAVQPGECLACKAAAALARTVWNLRGEADKRATRTMSMPGHSVVTPVLDGCLEAITALDVPTPTEEP